MQRPTAVPRIPASASGVSMQRSAPKRSWSPAVARKTPPSLPTSSPITSTDGSRSISTWSASFTASTSRSSATEDPAQLVEVARKGRWRIGVGVLEHERDVGRRLRLCLRDSLPHELERLVSDRRRLVVGEHAETTEIPLVATDALVLPLLLHTLLVDVARRIVGRRMRGDSVRHGLDERWAVTGPRAGDGLP